MKHFFLAAAILVSTQVSIAQERFEFGLGAGNSHPVGGETFKKAASSGDGHIFWLGYGLDDRWTVELGSENFDFDAVNSKHQGILLGGTYRFLSNQMLHPLAKIGLGSFESKDATDLKTSSMGVRAAAGLEAEFKYVSFGVLMNLYHIFKTDDAAKLENTQVLVPALYLSLHNMLGDDEAPAASQVEPAKSAPPAEPVKDTDGDGVSDADDKCPNTAKGVVVNKIGCAEKETASVRLNVNFESGKAELGSQYDSEIQNLASFMKRFPETKVEIAGHTDSIGDAKFNQSLSQKRAEAVRGALIKAGVEEGRVTANGYGSQKPVADNKTKAGRDQNRRVTAEISIEVDKKK